MRTTTLFESPSSRRISPAKPRSFSGISPLMLALCMAVAGCYDQVLVPADDANDRLAVTNDEAALDARVTYQATDVGIDSAAAPPSPTGGRASTAGAPARAPRKLTLTLRAEVDLPTVSGLPVQATSVSIVSGKKAVVSYNLRGATRMGALDYFTHLNKTDPRLTSSIVFADSDVNAVSASKKYIFAAVATDDASFEEPAVLERIDLTGNSFNLRDDVRVQLPSFAGTSVTVTDDYVYATSGDGGALVAFDENLRVVGRYALDDARWVAWDEEDDRIVVLQGTPGRLSIFREGSFPGGSIELLATYSVPGTDVPESKSTVEVIGGKAIVAAGPAGVQIVCLANGQVIGHVPIPDPASLGLDPSVVVTNAVTVDEEFLYISNGEAGVYVAAADEDFEDDGCDIGSIQVVGRLRLANLQSVNHVAFGDGLLYVAAGIGGLKIIEIDH